MSPLLNARVNLLRWAYVTAFGRGCLTWACDVTTIEREGGFTSLDIYFYMLLRLVPVVRRSCKRMEAQNTLRNRLVV